MINNIFMPLGQFEVTQFFKFNVPILGSLNLSLTNLGLYALISALLILNTQATEVYQCDPLSLSCLSFIPWHNTHSLRKGADALNRMYDSLNTGDPLKTFLDKQCLHLLKPLVGHTDIPTNMANPTALQSLPNTVKLTPSFTPSQFSNLPGTIGIYAFYLDGAETITQCGSSVSFFNRMASHYREAAKGNFIFASNPIQDFTWTPVAYSPNYVTLFNADNTMSPEHESILNAFTEQGVRSLEQAYTSWAKPTNYKGIAVSTSHNNWQAGDMHNKTEGKRITWTTLDGTVFTRASMSAGATELGYSLTYLKGLVRSGNPIVNTDKYGTVAITIDNVSVTNVDTLRYGTPLNTQVDITALQANQYYLYDTGMNKLPHGPFSTVEDTNLAMGLDPSYSGTYLWVNYMHTIHATALGMDVYVVKGLSTTKIPVVVTCVNTGEQTEHPSITSALKSIAPKNKGGYRVLKSMVQGKSIKGLQGMTYLLSFKDPNHLALSIKAYNVHKSTKPHSQIPTQLTMANSKREQR